MKASKISSIYFLLIICLSTVSAGDYGFPETDDLHSYCKLEVKTFPNFKNEVFNNVTKFILNGPDPAGGTYAPNINHTHNYTYLWAFRNNAKQDYLFDILFEFAIAFPCEDKYHGCRSITATSRSRALSYYDWNVNFCNLYNILA